MASNRTTRLAIWCSLRDNRKVHTVDGSQIWAMISAFCAVMVGGFGLMIWVIRSEVGGVRSELRAELRGEIGGLRAEMNARFADVDHRFQTLETDMHLIKAHLIGQRSEVS